MITDKTVFILGAGASKPYGFPTAFELRKDIISRFSILYRTKVAEYQGKTPNEIGVPIDMEELISRFRSSSTKSIDLFLTRNKKYYDLGKEIIAFLIADYEVNSKFREDIENPKQDWYFELYDILTREISDPDKLLNLISLNKVSFISFNYDRSLESFLYKSLANSFLTKRNELNQIMPLFKFIHVYGKLAPLPWESNGFSFRYGDEKYFEHLDEFIENIKIIFEDRKDGMEYAKNEILAAQKIFFLGFGYADENLAALEFSSLLNEDQWIYGTAMGSTEVERRKIANKLKGNNGRIPSQKIVIQDCDSVMLLRNHIG